MSRLSPTSSRVAGRKTLNSSIGGKVDELESEDGFAGFQLRGWTQQSKGKCKSTKSARSSMQQPKCPIPKGAELIS